MKTWTVLCSEIYPNATALDRLQCNKWVAFKSIFVTVFQTECFFFFFSHSNNVTNGRVSSSCGHKKLFTLLCSRDTYQNLQLRNVESSLVILGSQLVSSCHYY